MARKPTTLVSRIQKLFRKKETKKLADVVDIPSPKRAGDSQHAADAALKKHLERRR